MRYDIEIFFVCHLIAIFTLSSLSPRSKLKRLLGMFFHSLILKQYCVYAICHEKMHYMDYTTNIYTSIHDYNDKLPITSK